MDLLTDRSNERRTISALSRHPRGYCVDRSVLTEVHAADRSTWSNDLFVSLDRAGIDEEKHNILFKPCYYTASRYRLLCSVSDQFGCIFKVHGSRRLAERVFEPEPSWGFPYLERSIFPAIPCTRSLDDI